MPTYTCEKCARVFKRKSGYNDHKKKKTDCSQNTVLTTVIDAKVKEKVKEAIHAMQPKPEITSDTLPAFFEDLHNLLWNKAGLSPERALEHMTFFFAYRLIEQQADALSLPQECRWSFIASFKNENDLFETIKKGVSEFRKRPKTKPFFKQHEIQRADVVFEIVQQINRISLAVLQETDTLGDIFEYMLGRGMSTMSDEGQYFTNRAICKLAFKLAHDIKKTLRRADGTLCTMADWFCGTGGFPAEYVKGVKANLPIVDWKKDAGSIYCQDMNLSSVTTTLLNLLIITGIPFSGDKIRDSNSFYDPITTGAGAPFEGLAIDYCFMNPPYGGDKSKGKEYKFAYSKILKADDGSKSKKFFVNQEIRSIGIEDDDKVSAGVQLAMATLSPDGGVCSIVLPQGFFFGAFKKSVELRKRIAEEYKIWYVVDIASGSFLNTGTKTSMMVFQKGVGPTEKVSFIGLDESLLAEVTLADLQSKNYSLNFKQYLPQSVVEVEGFEMMQIKDVLEFQKKPGNLGSADGKEIGKYPFYTCARKKMFVDHCEFTKTCLIVNRGGMMNVRVDNQFSVSHDDIHVLSWIEGKTTELTVKYVAHYLGANMKLLENGMNGTTLKHLNKNFLEEFEIPLPSLERQQQIVDAIDGWAQMEQQEEQALKILEKQMMFQLREMSRGQPRVKLGEVCEIRSGKSLTKEQLMAGDVPVIGGGVSPMGIHNTHNREAYAVVVAQVGSAGNVSRYPMKSWITNNGMTIHPKGASIANDDILYYILKNIQPDIKGFAEGTAQPKLSAASVLSIEIPLPPLAEQQTLQSDFDEIRHKHEKIKIYNAKAQDAIRRLIPGADA
jgi:type I restriction-modification system DNA methylase subunit/restriction endonuclease S subunit